jgi:DNA-binding CsgD family transcriptional regulator
VVFLASTAGASDARPLDGLGWALLAANVLPLLALRRAPLLVVACLSVAYPAWAALEYPTHLLQSLPTLAAMVAVGASPRPLWWRALALLCPLEMLAGAATGIWDVDLLEIGYVAIVFVSGWVLGVVLAARRSYTRALEEKTAALEAARQELAHRAVHQTAAGGTVISPPTARRLVRDLAASRPEPRPTPAALQELTERELEVLRLLACGHSNRQIARDLVISDLTAKTHVSRILTKLDLAGRVHAVVFAYETGLVTPGTEG